MKVAHNSVHRCDGTRLRIPLLATLMVSIVAGCTTLESATTPVCLPSPVNDCIAPTTAELNKNKIKRGSRYANAPVQEQDVDPIVTGSIDAPASDKQSQKQPSKNKNSTKGSKDVTGIEDPRATSLGQLARLTIQTNPEIGESYWQSIDSYYNIDAVKSRKKPRVDLSVAAGPEVAGPLERGKRDVHTRNEATLSATQILFDFGRRDADISWAGNLHRSAVMRNRARTDDILSEMVDGYMTIRQFQEIIANSVENIKAHEEVYRIVKTSEEGGNSTKADVEKAFTRLEAAKTFQLDLISQREKAVSDFERITGIKPKNLKRPALFNKTTAKIVADASPVFTNNPNLQAIKYDDASLKWQADAIKAQNLPEVSLEGNARYQHNVSAETDRNIDGSVMVMVRSSLYDGGERKAKRKQIAARRLEATDRYRRLERELTQELHDLKQVISTAREKRTSINERKASAQTVVELYTEQYKAGRRTLFEVLDAQQELFNARGESITNHYDLLKSQYEILRLKGLLTTTLLSN